MVILFSHPADFTPVCTTEFMTFGSMQEEFRSINTELVGFVDRQHVLPYCLVAYNQRKIEYNGIKDLEIKFPVIEDISMNVAKLFAWSSPTPRPPRLSAPSSSSIPKVLSA
jgi:peroxiredoxin (alkyl hydroperoxide reductase subunit C)